MFHTAQTDNYLTALQALLDIATSDHVATVAINGGGTGYAVDEVLTITDGTNTFAATLIVTSVSSGVIDGVRVANGGAYTVDPDLTATTSFTTSGSGTGASFDLTMSGTGWTENRREYRAERATVTAGGTGYAVNDTLTVTGGTSSETATFNVDTVSGGAVTSVSVVTKGIYTVTPSNAVATTTDGGGSSCTLTVEYDQELILVGSGTGAQEINVGIKTFQDTDTGGFNTTFSWAMFGFTDYNSGLEFWDQPGISSGFANTPAGDPAFNTSKGAFVPLRDTNGSFPITFWFNITASRIIGVFKVRSATTTVYPSFHVGYLNPLGTTSELSFPMYVCGSSHRRNVYYADVTPYITGLSEMVGGGGDNGPGFYYRPSTSEWAGADNSDATDNGSSKSDSRDSSVYPGGSAQQETPASGFAAIVATGWGEWAQAIPDTGVPGTANWEVYPSYGAGDLYWLVPCTVLDHDDNDSQYLPYGEIDEVFWVGRGAVLTSEDTITIGNDVYRVFQNGNRTEEWSYMAIKESF